MRSANLLALVLFCAVIGFAVQADADTVYLKRGGSIEGKVIENETLVKVKLKDGSATFSQDEIERIEKSDYTAPQDNPVLKRLEVWGAKVSSWARPAQAGIQNAWANVKRTASGWMQPVGKAPAVKLKEKRLNDSLMEMQKALKATHAQEKAAAKAKRDLKKDSFLS